MSREFDEHSFVTLDQTKDRILHRPDQFSFELHDSCPSTIKYIQNGLGNVRKEGWDRRLKFQGSSENLKKKVVDPLIMYYILIVIM